MKVVIISPGRKDIPVWVSTFKKHNPDIEVEVYPDDTNREATEFIATWNPPQDAFEKYPNLKVIASMAAGVKHITSKKIPENVKVTRVKDEYLNYDLSYFVLSLVLNHIKHIPLYFKNQLENNWNRKMYHRPEDITVGILGFGNIGQAIGQLLQKNDFNVIGWSRSKKDVEGIKSYTEKELGNFLNKAEVLVCMLPHTPETENILNAELFHQLPKNAYLINVGRGAHLNEKDLISALDSEQLSGAALDVFKEEPLPENHPFWNHPKIFVTPHTASITNPKTIVPKMLENFKRFKNGKDLKDEVNLEKGY
ncbi:MULTISPECIES: 2-hydroxyacid dehydrogenase [Mesonia]|uniref:Glyoxylate/hydroxypyruvate reductase A n=1 Tax=Mesonia oceanica TaxID=2687242 RepID=A0AC61YCX3_9FLAO|nr:MULTISPECIES: glyoxylate/hydroxypyruvate reductase A [Mesonia]MAN27758.1 glyoxylate/hydroxypyruvate reductase A [Mesonia sp.]MAQ40672.1 glyoxylate/hydroxypyruvate reductase A [Mesonia sp.]MBJ96492.1 glyoxylate/hydroxypyruvate reductase A [Flavobacteriaceae bacterium]VVV02362.1 Glyoxylate/hydroxypyruvate reductase A [Mesonia oceanica]|tara:strand:+ start:7446 stop:8372 length:927 start_codon:yes stop_codon:yes gene_type:complete